METTFDYQPRGTCSRNIQITVDGDTVIRVAFTGGCSGNTQGVSALCAGMKIDDLIEKLSGIRCGTKSTSCPDQLADALRRYKNKNEGAS
ncbi:MAG: TIGR03905 family TSCPD domain-containing protein [Clostridiales bacterium]|nr:TIGR03905 family TSCPD domain-containing protein [Clostridiales bacterium]